jgi:hypothetical protein
MSALADRDIVLAIGPDCWSGYCSKGMRNNPLYDGVKMQDFKTNILKVIVLSLLICGFGMTEAAFADPYFLEIESDSAYPGEIITLDINLENPAEVAGFNLVLNYDLSVLTVTSISKLNTRSAAFEYFTYRLDYRGLLGDIGIFGLADQSGDGSPSGIASGTGPIAALSFYITNDLDYAGYSLPIPFVFRDGVEQVDNTLVNPDSVTIARDSISYTDAYIKIRNMQQGRIGDINLNGVTFEIGDVIVFTNYFLYPGSGQLNPQQILNSDVNRDGYGATIADLVYMISKLLDFVTGYKLSPEKSPVNIHVNKNFERMTLSYDSPCDLGGLYLILKSDGDQISAPGIFSEWEQKGMIVNKAIDNNLIRVLIYSDNGTRMPSGQNAILEIENKNNFDIDDIQLASAEGQLLKAEIVGDKVNLRPNDFVLKQNYPNPFNPSTELVFSLARTSDIRLTVYNVLGQEVKLLAEGTFTTGDHTVVWDGQDNTGRAVSSGVYFYRLSAENFVTEKKMLLLK